MHSLTPPDVWAPLANDGQHFCWGRAGGANKHELLLLEAHLEMVNKKNKSGSAVDSTHSGTSNVLVCGVNINWSWLIISYIEWCNRQIVTKRNEGNCNELQISGMEEEWGDEAWSLSTNRDHRDFLYSYLPCNPKMEVSEN